MNRLGVAIIPCRTKAWNRLPEASATLRLPAAAHAERFRWPGEPCTIPGSYSKGEEVLVAIRELFDRAKTAEGRNVLDALLPVDETIMKTVARADSDRGLRDA